jgi:hypothetical protein
MLTFSGCGEGLPPTYPVEGRVVLPGDKPLSGGLVEFQSIDGDGMSANASGTIDADGNFHLTTYKEGDGAVAGRHRAIVRPPRKDLDIEDAATARPKPIIDPRFENYETSGLEFTVTEGDNRFTIQVEQ